MALLTVDYNNAFPTVSHNFVRAMLVCIQLPAGFVDLVLSSLLSSYFFLVGSSVNKSHVFLPFSPLLFSFYVSFVIFPLNHSPRGLVFICMWTTSWSLFRVSAWGEHLRL